MVKANASTLRYVCETCGTRIEITVPYHLPNGDPWAWMLTEVNNPECVMQFTDETGFPHIVQAKGVSRVVLK